MSLRDFQTPYSDDPTALHHMPQGNETGLESFHTVQPEDIEPNNMPKIVGAIAVALMVSAAGMAFYASQGALSQSKQMIAVAPAATVPVNPVPAAAPLPDADMPATTPPSAQDAMADPNGLRAAPVKTPAARGHGAARASSAPASEAMSARMAAAAGADPVSTQPQQQAAVMPTSEQPAAPNRPPSDVASNNTQSSVAVPQGATAAADIPNPAPAQNANPIPASTEPSGQMAQ